MAGNRLARVQVRIPTHVPKELQLLWQAAAQHLENKGHLRTASGINYYRVNAAYQKLLTSYAKEAEEAGKRPIEDISSKTASRSDSSWPFGDITPTDIARFAERGEWDKVARAASLAARS